MKITFLIDRLSSGGAQSQLLLLAIGLRKRGDDVTILAYHQGGLFAGVAVDAGVPVVTMMPRRKLDKVRHVRAWLRLHRPDIFFALLPTPSALAELAGLGGRSWKLVVSERNSYDLSLPCRMKFKVLRQLHHLADWITTNSRTNLELIVSDVPSLAHKTSVIMNAVDLERFTPRPVDSPSQNSHPFKFLCVAMMAPSKNVLGVVEGLAILRKRTNADFVLRWVGRCNHDDPEQVQNHARVMARVRELDLAPFFHYAGERHDIPGELRAADGLVLASLFEGFPNVVCEAMAAGVPVVASAVSDVPLVIEEGVNGFLCDPRSPANIAEALEKCLSLSDAARRKMRLASREKADRLFGLTRYVDEYQSLFTSLLEHKRKSSLRLK